MATKHTKMLKIIGLNIAYYRKSKGLTQLDLAEKANISRTLMGHIEAANMSVGMTLETLLDIAEALEVEPCKLLDVGYINHT